MTSDPVARYLSQRGAKTLLASRLRPMSTGEIIDASLRLYQRIGLSFLRHSVVPTLLCLASLAFIRNYVLPGIFLSTAGSTFASEAQGIVIAVLLAIFVGGPLFLAGLSYTTSMVVSMASDYMVGNAVDADAAQELARRSMPKLFVVGLRELVLSLSGFMVSAAVLIFGNYLRYQTAESNPIGGIVTLIGVLLGVAGFFVFLAVLASDAIIAPVAVLENLGTRMATKRTRQLMKKVPIHGPGTQTLWGLYSILGIVILALWGGIETILEMANAGEFLQSVTAGLPFQQLLLQAFGLLPAFLTLWTVIPVWATTVTMLYFDRRIRLEGFDIEILGRDLARNSRTSRFEL